jgi:hypothetical protein
MVKSGRKRIAPPKVFLCAGRRFLQLQADARVVAYGRLENSNGLSHDFAANSIAGQDGDLKRARRY